LVEMFFYLAFFDLACGHQAQLVLVTSMCSWDYLCLCDCGFCFLHAGDIRAADRSNRNLPMLCIVPVQWVQLPAAVGLL
jgi:hypothetical protein